MTNPRRKLQPGVWRFFLFAALGVTAIRTLRYVLVDPPAVLDDFIGHAMVLQFLSMWLLMISIPVQMALVPVVALGTLFGPLRRRDGDRWMLRPRWATVLWAFLGLDSLVIDIHPEPLALYGATLATLYALTTRDPAMRLPRRERIGIGVLAVAALALALSQSRSTIDFGGIAAWIVVAPLLCLVVRRRLVARDALALGMLLAVAHQMGLFLAGFLVAGKPDSRRTVIATGDAYSFCETSDGRSIYAVVPSCVDRDVDTCRHDEIVEYDARDLSVVRRLQPFRDDFEGRMLHVVCLDDSLLVGMSFTKLGGVIRRENVMEVSMRDGSVLTDDMVGANAGHRMLLQPDGRAAYVVSEYSNVVLREPLDATSGEGGARARPLPTPIDLGVSGGQAWLTPFGGSLQTEVDAVWPAHGSGFFAEWLGGHRVHEVELATGRILRSYPVNAGGTHSMAVDLAEHRLVVTGLWGVEAIDLDSGRVVARRRTEVGPRLPVIDTLRDRIYVATTFGNHVWVLDRRTLAVIDKLPVGAGGRNGLLTRDGTHLLVGGGKQQVAWTLAPSGTATARADVAAAEPVAEIALRPTAPPDPGR